MISRVVAPDHPLSAQALRSLRHDLYHLPEYISAESRRTNTTPEAFVIIDGERIFFVPYLLRRCGDILAEEAVRIENRDELLPEESRTRMKEAVTRLYTLPTIVSAAVSSATNPEIGSRPQINPVQSTKVSSPGRGRSRKL